MASATSCCYSVFVFMALTLLIFLASAEESGDKQLPLARPCDEIYVVGEGETLHSISAKCGDAFIVDENPQIQDSDDVFPGLVIKITPPLNSRKLLTIMT